MLEFAARFIGDTPQWLLGLGMLATLMLSCDLGFLLHRRSEKRHDTTLKSDDGHILGAALGLLALMVAFTFSMAQARYDERRGLVVEEAAAISAAYLRASLLAEPERGELSAQLRRYIDIRLAYFDIIGDEARLVASDNAAETMHFTLWKTVSAISDKRVNANIVVAVADSIGKIIDMQKRRLAAREATVPAEVIVALIVYSAITALTLGYIMGGVHHRHRTVSTILFVLVTMSVVLTLDLDAPTSGGITLDRRPLLDTKAEIYRESAIRLPTGPPLAQSD